MLHRRRNVRNRGLGPRALAVISCALALLAAQPVVGGAVKGHSAAAAVRVAGAEVRGATSEVKVVRRREESASEGKMGVGFTNSRTVRVLATVEMLQRWLAAELRPTERQVLPIMVFSPAPEAIELAMTPPHRAMAVAGIDQLPLSSERQFVIEQCLLAPPVA